ncbi:hypothetical protein EG68_10573 [Paragonimus skrjabini miyazakii]|uniref:Uncharacterized protein n=1 Tax=Paragonimus skrjabini miyazakii TaxID=59628 RepID=A0A8S9YLI1_9TREM|nr:hypothetical protein EG68_10573 [Paragonimus skrjabini miyazakii]
MFVQENPHGLYIYLGIVGFMFLLLILLLLYLNKVACFAKCKGKTCFDSKKTVASNEEEAHTNGQVPGTAVREKEANESS